MLLGINDGKDDGSSDGLNDGDTEGDILGDTGGANVGRNDGIPLDFIDGLYDGALVGIDPNEMHSWKT